MLTVPRGNRKRLSRVAAKMPGRHDFMPAGLAVAEGGCGLTAAAVMIQAAFCQSNLRKGSSTGVCARWLV